MPSIGETARVKLAGSTGVGHTAPLEDLCQEAYRVARKLAEVHRFPAHTHKSPTAGPVKGHAGHMIMSRMLRQLWPEFSEDDFKKVQGLIYQVLRKTDAAVCIQHARPRSKDDRTPMTQDDMPVWFIADSMPENIVIVAIAHSKKSADQRIAAPFDESAFMTTRERFRVTPDEAGETLPPGEVTTVKVSTEPKQSSRAGRIPAHFEDRITARVKEHQRFVERVKEEIYTSPVPLTARDLYDIINRDPEWDQHETSYRNAVNILVKQGQIVGRQETPAEKVVRAGGLGMPKGKRTTLYWPVPGPVPQRTKLPEGVTPNKSAAEWDREWAEQRAQDDTVVFEALSRKGTHEAPTPRSSGLLADATGLPLEQVKASLARMVNQGRIVEHKGKYRPSDRVKTERPTPTAPVNQVTEPPADPLPPVTTPDTVQTLPEAPNPPEAGNLALVLDLAHRLGVELPKEDTEKVRGLEVTNMDQRKRIDDLARDNAKLREQVRTLRAAIASLD